MSTPERRPAASLQSRIAGATPTLGTLPRLPAVTVRRAPSSLLRMREPMSRVAVNCSLLVALLVLAASGVGELFANGSGSAWLYAVHRGAALALLPLACWKAPMVVGSLRRRRLATAVWPGLLLLLVVLGLALSGGAWVAGRGRELTLAGSSIVAWHLYFCFVLAAPLALHLRGRWRRPRPAAFRPRRTLLRLAATGGLVAAGGAAFAVLSPWLQRVPASRRFTGSFTAGTGAGNDFPITAFLSDDPPPVAVPDWRLQVRGQVARPHSLRYADLLPPRSSIVATIDCTGGWAAERRWSGSPLADLLARATPLPGARLVVVRSRTGYQALLTLAEAQGALLATHVGSEPLAHGHGAPLRLVLPGQRGFQWIKWVDAIEVI